MKLKIIADSGCDLNREIIDELNIDILNIIVTSDGVEYRDGIDIKSDELFKKQREGSDFKTAQIPLYDYLEKFDALASEGKDFIYISLSSGITGGYNNSLLALEEMRKKYPNVKMASVDSCSASVGFGLVTYYAALAVKNGANFEETVEFLDFLVENVRHIFTVFDMEYLYRGGRVSRTARSVGKILNIRPLINVKEKELQVRELCRGNHKSYKRMLEIIKSSIDHERSFDVIYPIYGEDEETIMPFLELLESDLSAELVPQSLGCAIGAHTGPDIIGAGYLENEIPSKFHKYLKKEI
ncbi:EDD domain protein, DegV family [Anaerosphaera aminiphila DSM 21120]|uniref:EDD domain protein, DegV family n=1 Tax=Anaerosphaera aminiphila DSM 21120 TaxID=1120995 RepID=A0A1M5SNG3_9FIRM|nr:DegV family protein [Anaerosphaera aminiphila]SHH40032.1 EDD domain protein, DegV family [Anaerosphaera aminiphila DSM 21120]